MPLSNWFLFNLCDSISIAQVHFIINKNYILKQNCLAELKGFQGFYP